MVLSLFGIGAILPTSPILFAAVKALDALALLGLGAYGISRAKFALSDQEAPEIVISFPAAFALAALHPGAIVFYAAFFPQFISPSGNALLQIGILGAIFLLTALATMVAWMSAAAIFKQSIKAASQLTLFKAIASGIMIVIGAASLIASVHGIL